MENGCGPPLSNPSTPVGVIAGNRVVAESFGGFALRRRVTKAVDSQRDLVSTGSPDSTRSFEYAWATLVRGVSAILQGPIAYATIIER